MCKTLCLIELCVQKREHSFPHFWLEKLINGGATYQDTEKRQARGGKERSEKLCYSPHINMFIMPLSLENCRNLGLREKIWSHQLMVMSSRLESITCQLRRHPSEPIRESTNSYSEQRKKEEGIITQLEEMISQERKVLKANTGETTVRLDE